MIIAINGSGKVKQSNSEYFLNVIKNTLKDETFIEFGLAHHPKCTEIISTFNQADAIIIAMPLYVDAVPAQVLKFMEDVESLATQKELSHLKLYVLANCGFYEAFQNHILLDIMKCWCEKLGMIWGQGIGIGCGEMYGSMSAIPLGKGPTKNLKNALLDFSTVISNRSTATTIYVKPNLISQRMFLLVANSFWDNQAKANGLKKKDLFRRMCE